ncbi:hypothetical protein LEP1GSC062_4407 [Leptospira alexanderi serovar Manhao 3 str. L 60]|uniref:Uncharacterized protein n=1 Tax=Leptospira alexanderi serovar Manhao 3 str. L 60 TaxID=1049759 RepID=V6I2G7_9LEPT|nr:hypothetical protein LEP1GSC062_4407 [Leptospira alexanderi serovar Manhao 3 str. L 60]
MVKRIVLYGFVGLIFLFIFVDERDQSDYFGDWIGNASDGNRSAEITRFGNIPESLWITGKIAGSPSLFFSSG